MKKKKKMKRSQLEPTTTACLAKINFWVLKIIQLTAEVCQEKNKMK